MASTTRQPFARSRPSAAAFTRFSRELIAMTLLFAVYKFGRVVHTSDVSLAYENAERVWDLERVLGLPNELHAQEAMLAVNGSIEFANSYYAFVHLPATALFLIWMYLRRPALYPPVRRAIIAMTAVGLVGHIVYPLAPPRMLPNLGFVDTGAVYGPTVYGGDPDASTLINQYAAMPSLHVGWAMLVAAGMIAAFRSRWRWLWLLHPTITSVAVVGTANHYWLDGIIACILLALVVYLFGNGTPIPWGRMVPRKFRRTPAQTPAGEAAAVDYYGIVPAESASPGAEKQPSDRSLTSTSP